MLRVSPLGQCRILLPMITDVAEIRTVRALLDEACVASSAIAARLRLGAMIETPAAAVHCRAIAREVDFLSIGTNDLTQYTLAMDRGHAELAARIDGLHPAVLRLIASAARARRRHGQARGRVRWARVRSVGGARAARPRRAANCRSCPR